MRSDRANQLRALAGAALCALGTLTATPPLWGAPAALIEPASGAASAERTGGEGEDTASTPAADSVAVVPAARQADNVAIITIRGPIDAVTATSVDRRLTRAEKAGADAVVFELDTPGGEVGAVLEITSRIKNSTIANTVAWVHPKAYSGGAIIALACREIVAAPAASLGDAAPISPVAGSLRKLATKDPELWAKMFAPLLGDVIDSARRNGYDEKLVQGFLMTGVDLWLVEDVRTGARWTLDRAEYRALFGRDPPEVPASFADPSAASASSSTAGRPGASTQGGAFPASGPALDKQAKEAIDEHLKLAPPSGRPVWTKEDPVHYRVLEHVSDGSTLLVLGTQDMLRLGLASAVVRDDEQLRAHFGAVHLRRLERTWSESLVRLLSSLPVKAVLVIVFLLGLYMEMAAPGIGLAGAVAVGALVGLAAPPLLLGAASWWSVAAVLVGVGLVLAEVLVIPGFGVAGLGGAVLILGGLIGLIAGEGALFPDSPAESQDLLYGLSTLLLALLTASVGMYFLSKRLGTLPVFRRLVLATSVPRQEERSPGMLEAMGGSRATAGPAPGDVGVVVADLRPAGRAEINGELVDVVSEMGFVEEGARVRVVEASRFRVVVEPVEGDHRAETGESA